MPIAPDVNDPEYWDQRAKESGQADDALGRGGVRQVCYQGGYVLHLRACRQSHHRLLMLRQCRFAGVSGFTCAIWLLGAMPSGKDSF